MFLFKVFKKTTKNIQDFESAYFSVAGEPSLLFDNQNTYGLRKTELRCKSPIQGITRVGENKKRVFGDFVIFGSPWRAYCASKTSTWLRFSTKKK